MAIDLHVKNIPQWVKEGRVFHAFGGVLTTPETQAAADLVRQTPTFFIRVPATMVIVPIQSQVAFEATTAILQVLVSSCNNDIGTATSVAVTPINQNSALAVSPASRVLAYATNTGATGTAPTGVADLYREYHQADRDAITGSPTPPITYSPFQGLGTPAIIGSSNNTHCYLFYAVAGTASASTCFHIHSWAEFTYDEFYAE